MNEYIAAAGKQLAAVRAGAPLVHNITNLVVMETTANALLALGASPIMAHAVEEMEEILSLASALVLNIGTLSPTLVDSMRLALASANSRCLPVVIDPVGAGASAYRTRTVHELLAASSDAILRGNASEIAALARGTVTTKGVDSGLDVFAVEQDAVGIALRYGCTVCVSGPVDLVVNGKDIVAIEGGSALMTRVTGMGCTASAFCAAFAATAGKLDKASRGPARMSTVISAMSVMSAAGGLAAAGSSGPGSFLPAFFDRVSSLSEDDLKKNVAVRDWCL